MTQPTRTLRTTLGGAWYDEHMLFFLTLTYKKQFSHVTTFEGYGFRCVAVRR